jgi:hypothetical protein
MIAAQLSHYRAFMGEFDGRPRACRGNSGTPPNIENGKVNHSSASRLSFDNPLKPTVKKTDGLQVYVRAADYNFIVTPLSVDTTDDAGGRTRSAYSMAQRVCAGASMAKSSASLALPL